MGTVHITQQDLLENYIKVTWSNGDITIEDYLLDEEGSSYAKLFRDDIKSCH